MAESSALKIALAAEFAKALGGGDIGRWRSDPIAFAKEALGVERLWYRQLEIMKAATAHQRVAVRSGHKISKSFTAAILALWWAYTRRQGRVVLTSASGRQVRSILWGEIRQMVRRAKVSFPSPAKVPDLGMQWEDGRYIVGFSTDDAEKMAGVSGAEVLFIADEASGIQEQIFEAIEGNRAGGAKLVMFSNPTQTSGTFFDAFNNPRATQFWHTIHVSSEEAAALVPPIPALATQSWVEEKRKEWGEESPLYQVRVLGNFPTQSDNAVVSLGLVEAAEERYESTLPVGRLELGVDVARFGSDESVIFPRRGFYLYPAIVVNGIDTVGVAGKVLETVQRLKGPEGKARVKVDAIGVGGGVVDILRQHKKFLEVVEVNSSSASSKPEEFTNLRAELHFGVAEWLRDGGALPDDAKLHGELLAPIYTFDLRGRRKVESKDDIKRRLPEQRSPDRADALALAVYQGSNVVPILAPKRPTNASRFPGSARGFG